MSIHSNSKVAKQLSNLIEISLDIKILTFYKMSGYLEHEYSDIKVTVYETIRFTQHNQLKSKGL